MRSQRSNLAKYLDDLFVSTPKAVRLGGYSLDTFYAPIQVEQQGRSQSLLAWIIERTDAGTFLHPAYEVSLTIEDMKELDLHISLAEVSADSVGVYQHGFIPLITFYPDSFWKRTTLIKIRGS